MVRTLVLYATMLLVPLTPLTACAAQVPLSDGAKLQLGNHSCFFFLSCLSDHFTALFCKAVVAI